MQSNTNLVAVLWFQGQLHRAKRHMYAACEVRRDRVFLYLYNCSPGVKQQLDTYVTRALAWQVGAGPAGLSCRQMTSMLGEVLRKRDVDSKWAYPLAQVNRAHLLISILHQKMGLYHHLSPELPQVSEAPGTPEFLQPGMARGFADNARMWCVAGSFTATHPYRLQFFQGRANRGMPWTLLPLRSTQAHTRLRSTRSLWEGRRTSRQ